ncbi:molybdopterin molybdotransferase MoeA [Starkeya sp. ORNL1]|uniref:molybdopterin molybdotransferase MoeA n=1 Tax=Starkeya sp. ORNL1 TaxID=2709380 RepID=UPI001463DBB9|nr:gephyrin-like molybdotransferase Glp [Starkeya sp. ORNL1]QJP12839.1 molybdopterin molybdotransferase MoeA [Starkeya sp. ORNL1]
MALIPTEEALARVLAGAGALDAETVPVGEAHHRVLASAVIAGRTTPAADVSAMDGYAVRAADVATVPVTLTLAGEAAAGRPHDGTLQSGETVRVFTGGVIPAGADAVVIQEDTRREGERITMLEATTRGRHVRFAGGDFAKGDIVLQAGHRLTARDLALAAAADHANLEVVRRPRVGIFATGDELVPPGTGAGPHQVILSNIYAVGALARLAGAEVVDLGRLADTPDATRAGLTSALAADLDVLVTTGGASVGDHDLVAPTLLGLGIELAVHKIALRPGKPLMFGHANATRILGLPGNPVSAHVCALLFLVPLLRRLQGETAGVDRLPLTPAELGVDLKANDLRMDFMRAEIIGRGARGPIVRPLPVQDSSMLRLLARADALLVRPPHAPAGRAGDACDIVLLND